MRYRHPAPRLPNGWIDWIKPFWKIDDEYILNNCSLDGYLFLRFLKILAVICFAGLAISWPILLPINATGGNVQRQLDKLTMGNIKLPSKYYAHVVVAWLFFGQFLLLSPSLGVGADDCPQDSCCSWFAENASTTSTYDRHTCSRPT